MYLTNWPNSLVQQLIFEHWPHARGFLVYGFTYLDIFRAGRALGSRISVSGVLCEVHINGQLPVLHINHIMYAYTTMSGIMQHYSSWKSQNSSIINLKSKSCPICAHIHRMRNFLRIYRSFHSKLTCSSVWGRYSHKPDRSVAPFSYADSQFNASQGAWIYIYVNVCLRIFSNIYIYTRANILVIYKFQFL